MSDFRYPCTPHLRTAAGAYIRVMISGSSPLQRPMGHRRWHFALDYSYGILDHTLNHPIRTSLPPGNAMEGPGSGTLIRLILLMVVAGPPNPRRAARSNRRSHEFWPMNEEGASAPR